MGSGVEDFSRSHIKGELYRDLIREHIFQSSSESMAHGDTFWSRTVRLFIALERLKSSAASWWTPHFGGTLAECTRVWAYLKEKYTLLFHAVCMTLKRESGNVGRTTAKFHSFGNWWLALAPRGSDSQRQRSHRAAVEQVGTWWLRTVKASWMHYALSSS